MDNDAPSAGNRPKFRNKLTERFAKGERIKQFHVFKEQAERRLDVLEAAISVDDLKKLPSNRLETLGGDRKGQYSIRINSQWRVCFEWPADAERPFNIEIVDYH